MAASSSPYGLRPVKRLGQTYMNHGFNQFPIASGYNTDIKTGDLVKLVAAGGIEKETGTTSINSHTIGVFIGCSYTDANLGFVTKQMWPANTVASDAMAYVVDDPDVIFQINADGSLSQADVGLNAALVQGSGSTTLGLSGVQLDASTAATTNTLPVRIVGMVDIEGFSTPGDAFTDVLVKLNTTTSYSNTTGI